jgi:hypothetical protein
MGAESTVRCGALIARSETAATSGYAISGNSGMGVMTRGMTIATSGGVMTGRDSTEGMKCAAIGRFAALEAL